MKTFLLVVVLSFISFFGINYFYMKKYDMLIEAQKEKEKSMSLKYDIKSKLINKLNNKLQSIQNEYEEKLAFLESKEKELDSWQKKLDEKQIQKEIIQDEVEQLDMKLADSNQLLDSLTQSIKVAKSELARIKKDISIAKARRSRYNSKKAKEMISKFYNLYYVNELRVAEACKADYLNRKYDRGECNLARKEKEAARYLLEAIKLYADDIKKPNKYQRFLKKHTKALTLIR